MAAKHSGSVLWHFAFLLAAGPVRAAAPALLIDGTAATVGKTLITVQDAYFFRALQRFRMGEPQLAKPEEGDALRKTVQKVVFEEMVFAEMKSFQFEEGSRADAEREVQIQRAKGKEGVWREILSRYGHTEAQALLRLLKGVQVEKFIQKKVETLTPIITEGEAERYYKQNQSRFQGSSFESLRPNIILLLKKQRMQQGLEEWVRFLKEKYGVTNLLES